jgi:hypothetical protein
LFVFEKKMLLRVNRIELAQDELAQNLDSIMSQQKELDQMLTALEKEVKVRLFKKQFLLPFGEQKRIGFV